MKYIFYLLLLVNVSSILADRPSAMTFQSGGRLGDKLMTYCKAKWFSYKYGIPFLCPDFSLKKKLMLAEKEDQLTKEIEASFKHKKEVKYEKDINQSVSDTLYKIDFYVTAQEFPDIGDIKKVFNEHPAFLAELRALIAPRTPLTPLVLPEDMVTVAVHVRRGSGGDRPLLHAEAKTHNFKYSDEEWPTKFPPDEYYIDQIKRLYAMVGGQPLYVFIFTDYNNPEEIACKYQEALNLPNITFGWRTDNEYQDYEVQDLFLMMQFDCLIRSSSFYSSIPYLLGDHRYMIAATQGSWHNNFLTIDEILVSYRHEDGSITFEYVDT